MATQTGDQRFVDEITTEIIQPGVERLMESRYFAALRTGELTTRQLGGFAIQHYIHNMAVLKGFALVAVQRAADDGAVQRVDGGQAHAVHGDGHGWASPEGGTTVRQRARRRNKGAALDPSAWSRPRAITPPCAGVARVRGMRIPIRVECFRAAPVEGAASIGRFLVE